jgi:hypothetical protein
MKRDRSLHGRAVVLVLTLVLSAGCGDDGTGPGGNGNGEEEAFTEFSAGIGGVYDAYFASNAGAFLALQTFAPLFQTAFSPAVVPGSVAAGSLLLQGCIDPAAFGTTYEFDFGSNTYAPGGMTGAPADGVRFLLYQNQQSQGHADVTCPGDLPTINITLAVEWNGVAVFDLAGVGLLNQNLTWQFNSTSATLTNPGNSAVLDFSMGGTGAGAQVVSSRLGFDAAGGMTVTFGRNDFEGVEVTGSAGTSEWSASLMVSGSSADALSGNVLFDTPITEPPAAVACVSGSYENPTISTTNLAECAGEFPTLQLDPDPQADIAEGYQALRQMLATVIGILETGIQIAIAAS